MYFIVLGGERVSTNKIGRSDTSFNKPTPKIVYPGRGNVKDAFVINDVSRKKVGFTACSLVCGWLKYVIFYLNMIILLSGTKKPGNMICISVN